MLAVREVFATIQGEGSRAGQPAVFVRLAGCNLWSGLEDGRATGRGTCAAWCDTDFAHGDRVEILDLVDAVALLMEKWPAPFVVITGGEPLLQLRKHGVEFVRDLKARLPRCVVAVETNGTVEWDALHETIDHVTVSPKPLKASPHDTSHLVVRTGTDLKLVEAGAVLFVDEGRLLYWAPVGVLTSEIRGRAAAARAALIALVRSGAVLPADLEAWPHRDRAAVDEHAGEFEFELGLDWEVARQEAERTVRLEHTRGFLARAAFVVTPDAVAVAPHRPGSGPRRGS